MSNELLVFGKEVGLALAGRKIPADVDPNKMSDAQALEATAWLLDKLDDATDRFLAAKGSTERVGRTMQARLREIAARIGGVV